MPPYLDTTRGGEDLGDGQPRIVCALGYPEEPLDIAIAQGAREILAAGGPSKAA